MNVLSPYVIFYSFRLCFSVLCPLKTYWLIILIYLSENLVRIDLGTSALKSPILWTSFSWLPQPAQLAALWFVNVNFIKYQYSLLNHIQIGILALSRWETGSCLWPFRLFLDSIFLFSYLNGLKYLLTFIRLYIEYDLNLRKGRFFLVSWRYIGQRLCLKLNLSVSIF